MYLELNVLQTDIDLVVCSKVMPCPSAGPRHFGLIWFFCSRPKFDLHIGTEHSSIIAVYHVIYCYALCLLRQSRNVCARPKHDFHIVNSFFCASTNVFVGVLNAIQFCGLKFIFSKKAKKIDKIFTVNLIVCRNRQIDSERIL